jgi:pyrroline-5-carboxylate reductase
MTGLAGPLLLVGCGKMGGALLDGWLAHGLAPGDAVVVEPDAGLRSALRQRHPGLALAAGAERVPPALEPRAIVFAVKPQAMAPVLPAYVELARGGAVLLSIAAGTAVARFRSVFGEAAPIVRTMPNTPAAIGRGASVLYATPSVSAAQRDLCFALMAAVGEAHWIEDEELMHAVTAVSGSGPAYVFLLIEALGAAGRRAGLPAELARALALATVAGSGALAEAAGEPPEALRRNVTSPGGTTEAALAVLMADDGLPPLLERAVAAAAQRSRELA